MAADKEKIRAARAEYIFKRRSLAMIALSLGVSANTVGRWKRAAREAGDNWDTARAAHMIAGQGLDVVITTVVEEFMIQAQATLEDLKTNGDLSLDKRVAMIASLGDAMVKVTNSAGKLAPKISELGVAQDVIARLIEFVKEHYPQHAGAILEICEPFGARLIEAYK